MLSVATFEVRSGKAWARTEISSPARRTGESVPLAAPEPKQGTPANASPILSAFQACTEKNRHTVRNNITAAAPPRRTYRRRCETRSARLIRWPATRSPRTSTSGETRDDTPPVHHAMKRVGSSPDGKTNPRNTPTNASCRNPVQPSLTLQQKPSRPSLLVPPPGWITRISRQAACAKLALVSVTVCWRAPKPRGRHVTTPT